MYDRKEALEIREYLNVLQSELAFLRNPPPPPNIAVLQQRLVELKKKVSADHKQVNRKSSKEGLTLAEQYFLSTALQHILSAFTIRTNTTPLSLKWNVGLCKIAAEVGHFLDKVTHELQKDV